MIIITQLIITLLLLSGVILGTVFHVKHCEFMLPITCMSIVLFLFIFGILGLLIYGIYATIIILIGIYAFSIFRFIKSICNSGIKTVQSQLRQASTTIIIFAICIIITTYCNYGHRVTGWDEFSHWATVVKHMVINNTLGCDKNATAVMFQSYPPAMALFQYFIQRIVIFLNPGIEFSEWHLYFAYQIFSFSFIVPFINHLNFKKFYNWILAALAFLSIVFIFNDGLKSIYIDSFVGLISGVGLATTFLLISNQCKSYKLTVLLTISTLILSKDVGLLFAILLCISYCIAIYPQKFISFLSPLFAVIIPKITWDLCLKYNNITKAFSGKINIQSLINVILGNETSYRQTVIITYLKRTIRLYENVQIWGISMPVLFVLATLFVAIYLVFRLYSKNDNINKTKYKLIVYITYATSILYLIGLLLIYMYKFTEYEAIKLASYERYIGIMFNCLLFFSILSFIPRANKCKRDSTLITLCLLCIYLSTNVMDQIRPYLLRETTKESIAAQAERDSFYNTIQSQTDSQASIYFISQETTGYDYWNAKFNLMPRQLNGNYTWSIGEPFYEGDQWTRSVTAEEWQESLMNDYDYVALYKVNDYFIDEFATLFENPDEIQNETLFKVNKTSGLLELIS